MPCNSCQQELFETLGYSLWVPQTYNLNDVVISPGNSNLYQSTSNDNTTAPAQPGAEWVLTTVAQLIPNSALGSVLEALGYDPYEIGTPYSQNQGVLTAQGYVATSNIGGTNTNLGNVPPTTPGKYTDWTVWATFSAIPKYILDFGVFH